ncbi:hypothetical protein P2G88_06355 [Aliiglaciecola sp. CAU 1673]|uniref:hypothetical protein n=1 Tax=Aliiglaciecola sp. CAU 1673 TaxID=3032595 RepID=UPI0023DC64FA|nr:hypothetical protein [Aliiglaciecola sp. CAU 1673]MDF2177868.1 hypothetical protein [Aliiglaciecola sp. CAU 1673]
MSYNMLPHRGFHKEFVRIAIFLSFLFCVFSCGGSNNEENSGVIIDNDPGVIVDSGSNGKLAEFREVPIPVNVPVMIEYVTNSGIYLKGTSESSEKTFIIKGVGQLSGSDSWVQAVIDDFVYDFAPSNVYGEREREINFYWVSSDKWGRYSANGGSPSFEVENDMHISRVAAGGIEGIATPRPWVIAGGIGNYNRGIQYVYQDDGEYTSSQVASDYFSKAADTQVYRNSDGILISDPKSPTLYIGTCNKIDIYEPDRFVSSHSIQTKDDLSCIRQMIFYEGKVWFSHGGKVYLYHNVGIGISEEVAQVDVLFSSPVHNALPGRFCIYGGEIFLPDGTAKRISDGRVRNWIRSGELTPMQTVDEAMIKGWLGSGMYCSPDASGPIIYTQPNNLSSVIVVFPLAPDL